MTALKKYVTLQAAMTLLQLTKKIATLEHDLTVVRLELLQTKNKSRKTNVWETTAGVLKSKLPRNSVAWQKKIRSEWD